MTSAPLLPQLARRVRRRVALGLWISEIAFVGSTALFAVGIVVLLGRSWSDLPRERWGLAFLAVGLVPLLAHLRLRGRGWSERDASAWLDVHSGGAGLLVAQSELGVDPAWSERLRAPLARVPDPPRARFGRALTRIAPALVFALAAFWVQVPRPTPIGPPISLLRSLVGALDGKLDFLESELDLDETAAADLRERIERLRGGIGTGSAEALFAALDGIEASLGAEADQARRGAGTLLERIAGAGDEEQLAGALGGALRSLQESGLARELGPQLLEQLAGSGALRSLASELTAEFGQDADGAVLEQLLREGLLEQVLGNDPTQRAQAVRGMLGASEWLRGELEGRIDEFSARGLVDAPLEAPSTWESLVQRFGSGLPGLGGGRSSGSSPGSGGGPARTDDPADGESAGLAAELRATPLAPAGAPDPDRSALLAVEPAAPDAGPEPIGEWAGLEVVPEGRGAGAWKRRLSPLHRRVVRNFFSEDPKD